MKENKTNSNEALHFKQNATDDTQVQNNGLSFNEQGASQQSSQVQAPLAITSNISQGLKTINKNNDNDVCEPDKPVQKNVRPLRYDIAALLIRIVAITSLFLILFSFIFEVFRCGDGSMIPSVQEGDMVIVYRLDKRYASQDLVAFSYNGDHTTGRVVAVAGDKVEIDDKGLKVNGSYQYEPKIFTPTQLVKDGVTFPLSVPKDEVFVLGDNRKDATDSRVLGCIKTDQTEGKVIGLFRRRNF